MKIRIIIICCIMLLTGCNDKPEVSMVDEIRKLTTENTRINEKIYELENRIAKVSIENEELEKKLERKVDINKKVKNFTLDMNYSNEYPSRSNLYRVITNKDGTFLLNESYEPLDIITTEAFPTQNCWSKNDKYVTLQISYEWHSDYFVL